MKILEKVVWYYIRKRLSFNANLYDRGIVKSERTEKDSREKKKVLEALTVLAKS